MESSSSHSTAIRSKSHQETSSEQTVTQKDRNSEPKNDRTEGNKNGLNSCAVCGTPARTWCTGCSKAKYLTPGYPPLFYCGKECQQSDWRQHKAICKDRRRDVDQNALHRAMHILQSSFLLFRRVVFDSPIASIKVDGNRLIIQEGNFIDTEVFYDPPDNELKCLENRLPDIAAMVLCVMACTDAQVFAEDLFKVFLEDTGLTRKIEEIGGYLKPTAIKWTIHRHKQVLECEDYYAHAFHRIVLKDGSVWAVDLVGAQFGQMSTLMPWGEYTTTKMKTVSTVNSLGFTQAKCRELMPLPTGSGPVWTGNVSYMLAIRSYATDEVGKQFVRGLLAGMKEAEVTALDLLTNTSGEDLESICAVMESRAREYGEDLKAEWAEAGGIMQRSPPKASSCS